MGITFFRKIGHFVRNRISIFPAFMLAEVVIVIGIIGIIAEITLPALITNVQNEIYKTSYKNVYSILNQAMLSVTSDNNGSIKGVCADSDNTCIRELFASKMKWIKKCESGDIDGKCVSSSWTRLNGDAGWRTPSDASAMILNNGTSIAFINYRTECNLIDDINYSSCGSIQIDTNGLKTPNKMGKDIFCLHLHESNIKPFGTPGDWVSVGITANGLDNYYSCVPKGDGEGCAYDYLYK